MLKAPEHKSVVQALAGLNDNEDWQVVQEWIADNLGRIQRNNSIEKDDTVVRWNQGALQVLEDLTVIQRQARTMVK